MAGLEERIGGGWDGGGEDAKWVVADEAAEEGDVGFCVDGAEVHFNFLFFSFSSCIFGSLFMSLGVPDWMMETSE